MKGRGGGEWAQKTLTLKKKVGLSARLDCPSLGVPVDFSGGAGRRDMLVDGSTQTLKGNVSNLDPCHLVFVFNFVK